MNGYSAFERPACLNIEQWLCSMVTAKRLSSIDTNLASTSLVEPDPSLFCKSRGGPNFLVGIPQVKDY